MALFTFQRPGKGALLSHAAILASGIMVGMTAWRIAQSVRLARKSQSFDVSPSTAAASLLIVGDSTAVGTGASSPAASLAGQIAAAYPHLRIVNKAQVGARFAEIATQLHGAERFDLILIVGGGNDVMRLTSQALLRETIERTVRLARARARHVIVLVAGNLGNAPFFVPPLSWYMRYRARILHRLAATAARAHGAGFVDLFRRKHDDPFAQEPQRMTAADHLHPSDAGYAFWFAELERQVGLQALFDNPRKGGRIAI